MRSLTPPLFPFTSKPAFIVILCGSLLGASAAEKAPLPAGPAPAPQFRFQPPKTAKSHGDLVTLEDAYEGALASDEAIQLAYYSIRKARLVRWNALTRLEPKISGAIARRDNNEDRNTTEHLSENTKGNEQDFSSQAGSQYSTEQQLRRNSAISENFFENKQGLTSASDSLRSRRNDFLSSNTVRDTATIILEQPLLDLTVFPAYRLGRLAEQSAQYQFQFTIRDVLLGVARAYFDLLKAERLMEVNRQTIELSDKQLVLAKQRFDAGMALRAEVLRAESTVGDARRLLLLSENARGVARDTLRSILNRPDADFHVVEPAAGSRPSQPMAELLQRALNQREDYKNSTTQVSQEIERRNEVAAGFMPRVVAELRARSLNYSDNSSVTTRESRDTGSNVNTTQYTTAGSYGSQREANPPGSAVVTGPITKNSSGQSTEISSSQGTQQRKSRANSQYSSQETEWEAMLTVEMPLGGARAVELRASRYQITQAELNRDKVGKTIERELFDAANQVDTLQQTIALLRTQVSAADQNYKDLENQYEAGTATSIDLLVALRDLNRARTELVSDTYEYEFALRNLQRTTGDFEDARVKAVRFADFGHRSKTAPAPVATAPRTKKK